MNHVHVIGAGLAGCEAAYCIARAGHPVTLWEMRPEKKTAVHTGGGLAELVCSNSLKSEAPDTAQGLLKQEMRMLRSLLLECADLCRVPAGSALAVDRQRFSDLVTQRILQEDNITLIRKELTELPEEGICIIATGPLTEGAFYQHLCTRTGEDQLFFYDAVAPSVTLDSLNMSKIFRAARYGKGTEDYLNCPMTKEEYEEFYQALVEADTAEGHAIDREHYFEGCMPVEVMAGRGLDTLRYGPMRPVGLTDPHTGHRPWAVVQLRQENLEGTIYGLVGFQTRLRWGEQARVFRMIPGLEEAEFVRCGVMHRNTYINSPHLLSPTLQFKMEPRIFVAGQITGVEGYMESAATGILAGMNAVCALRGHAPLVPPANTMLGSLVTFITQADVKHFQPMNANFGIIPPLAQSVRDKKLRYGQYVMRSLLEMRDFSELFYVDVVK